MPYKAPRGTQDILPGKIPIWRYVENTARRVCELYGYQEIRPPIFEDTNLFTRSIGAGTDIVEKEMYTFKGEKGGTSITLRPELTAPVVRAYLEHHLHKDKKFQKLYYLGPLFRHERPQKGRTRQFHQLGVEALGSYDALLDVEVIDLALIYFKTLGLDDYKLKINSIGCPTCRTKYRDILKRELTKSKPQLCEDCKKRFDRNVFRILDCKNQRCYEITTKITPLKDYLCQDCKDHFAKVSKGLQDNKIEYILDPHLVRGFDYYTKTIFEITHPVLGAQDALCGGGRYDNLVAELGGPEIGAAGFAIGLERTILVLESKNLGQADKEVDKLKVFIAAIGENTRPYGFRLLNELRRRNIAADMDYEDRSIKAQMRLADKLKTEYVIIVGPEEMNKQTVKLKSMDSGQEKEISRQNIFDLIT